MSFVRAQRTRVALVCSVMPSHQCSCSGCTGLVYPHEWKLSKGGLRWKRIALGDGKALAHTIGEVDKTEAVWSEVCFIQFVGVTETYARQVITDNPQVDLLAGKGCFKQHGNNDDNRSIISKGNDDDQRAIV